MIKPPRTKGTELFKLSLSPLYSTNRRCEPGDKIGVWKEIHKITSLGIVTANVLEGPLSILYKAEDSEFTVLAGDPLAPTDSDNHVIWIPAQF